MHICIHLNPLRQIGEFMAVERFSLLVSLSFLLSLSLFSPLLQATDVHYCDKEATYAVNVSGVEISPYLFREASQPPSAFPHLQICDSKRWRENWVKRRIQRLIFLDEREKAFPSLDLAKQGETISGGKLVIDVSYFWFHIYSESYDLCGKTPCPISAGDFVISHSQVLPGFTPPGMYTLRMKMEDGNNIQLTCVTFDFSIGFIALEAAADIYAL